MPGVSMKIDLKGMKQMRNLLQNYAQAIGGNRAELHMRYGIQAMNWIDRNFRAQGGLLATGPWAKLRPNTIAGRRKNTSLVLQDSGQMRQSYQMNFDSQKAVVGSADPKALWHGKGTKPYTIRPKTAKALAFPVAEGGRAVTVAVRLQSARHGTGKYRKGQKLAFAQEVHHPGLPARRMLPTEQELLPQLLRTSINFLNEKALYLGQIGSE